jgi:predicted DNA-binding protein
VFQESNGIHGNTKQRLQKLLESNSESDQKILNAIIQNGLQTYTDYHHAKDFIASFPKDGWGHAFIHIPMFKKSKDYLPPVYTILLRFHVQSFFINLQSICLPGKNMTNALSNVEKERVTREAAKKLRILIEKYCEAQK